MATDVVMPQMGESIAEGTIVRWIKKVGDKVERDEPLFEISTDKVDAEIPSPIAGVITEIRHQEGETVPVNSVVAVIGAAGEASAVKSAPPVSTPKPAAPPPAAKEQADGSAAPQSATPAPRKDETPPARTGPRAVPPTPSDAGPSLPGTPERVQREGGSSGAPGATSREAVIRERSSPLVRRIAKEHNIDISQIRGSGIAGRVTKDDILAFVGSPPRSVADAPGLKTGPTSQTPSAKPEPGRPGPSSSGAGLAGQTVPMSIMRRKIAEHMIASRRTSAHVHSVFEVNFSKVDDIRRSKKAEYERAGAKLTYLSFILKAAVDALRAVPVVNASVEGENVVYHREVNVGIAVALDWGLIVPVIKNADEKNLLGLSRTVADLAGRARSKQLKPDEVSGGTFTVTNPGVFGALFGMPIINQPQLAILGVGMIEKRVIVVDDAIAIRPMAYLSLGYDHRIIDGAVADEFMSHIKRQLENWDESEA
jgi:pyruvate dehydrogenase E2 component (dihydrolipoyllysine-residue acetyltransferase)